MRERFYENADRFIYIRKKTILNINRSYTEVLKISIFM